MLLTTNIFAGGIHLPVIGLCNMIHLMKQQITSAEQVEMHRQEEKAKSGRIGEAFATGIQMHLEDFLMEDVKAYVEALAKRHKIVESQME